MNSDQKSSKLSFIPMMEISGHNSTINTSFSLLLETMLAINSRTSCVFSEGENYQHFICMPEVHEGEKKQYHFYFLLPIGSTLEAVKTIDYSVVNEKDSTVVNDTNPPIFSLIDTTSHELNFTPFRLPRNSDNEVFFIPTFGEKFFIGRDTTDDDKLKTYLEKENGDDFLPKIHSPDWDIYRIRIGDINSSPALFFKHASSIDNSFYAFRVIWNKKGICEGESISSFISFFKDSKNLMKNDRSASDSDKAVREYCMSFIAENYFGSEPIKRYKFNNNAFLKPNKNSDSQEDPPIFIETGVYQPTKTDYPKLNKNFPLPYYKVTPDGINLIKNDKNLRKIAEMSLNPSPEKTTEIIERSDPPVILPTLFMQTNSNNSDEGGFEMDQTEDKKDTTFVCFYPEQNYIVKKLMKYIYAISEMFNSKNKTRLELKQDAEIGCYKIEFNNETIGMVSSTESPQKINTSIYIKHRGIMRLMAGASPLRVNHNDFFIKETNKLSRQNNGENHIEISAYLEQDSAYGFGCLNRIIINYISEKFTSIKKSMQTKNKIQVISSDNNSVEDKKKKFLTPIGENTQNQRSVEDENSDVQFSGFLIDDKSRNTYFSEFIGLTAEEYESIIFEDFNDYASLYASSKSYLMNLSMYITDACSRNIDMLKMVPLFKKILYESFFRRVDEINNYSRTINFSDDQSYALSNKDGITISRKNYIRILQEPYRFLGTIKTAPGKPYKPNEEHQSSKIIYSILNPKSGLLMEQITAYKRNNGAVVGEYKNFISQVNYCEGGFTFAYNTSKPQPGAHWFRTPIDFEKHSEKNNHHYDLSSPFGYTARELFKISELLGGNQLNYFLASGYGEERTDIFKTDANKNKTKKTGNNFYSIKIVKNLSPPDIIVPGLANEDGNLTMGPIEYFSTGGPRDNQSKGKFIGLKNLKDIWIEYIKTDSFFSSISLGRNQEEKSVGIALMRFLETEFHNGEQKSIFNVLDFERNISQKLIDRFLTDYHLKTEKKLENNIIYIRDKSNKSVNLHEYLEEKVNEFARVYPGIYKNYIRGTDGDFLHHRAIIFLIFIKRYGKKLERKPEPEKISATSFINGILISNLFEMDHIETSLPFVSKINYLTLSASVYYERMQEDLKTEDEFKNNGYIQDNKSSLQRRFKSTSDYIYANIANVPLFYNQNLKNEFRVKMMNAGLSIYTYAFYHLSRAIRSSETGYLHRFEPVKGCPYISRMNTGFDSSSYSDARKQYEIRNNISYTGKDVTVSRKDYEYDFLHNFNQRILDHLEKIYKENLRKRIDIYTTDSEKNEINKLIANSTTADYTKRDLRIRELGKIIAELSNNDRSQLRNMEPLPVETAEHKRPIGYGRDLSTLVSWIYSQDEYIGGKTTQTSSNKNQIVYNVIPSRIYAEKKLNEILKSYQ